MSCEHEHFAPPDDADTHEESAFVQLDAKERPLFYCCYCKKLLLPTSEPLLLPCLHSSCRQCAAEQAKGKIAAVGGGGDSSTAAAAHGHRNDDPAAAQRLIARHLAELHDSVLVRRRLRSSTAAAAAAAAAAVYLDLPPCDPCLSDAGGATSANSASEWCDSCSLRMCPSCRAWHDKFYPRHQVVALEVHELDSSSCQEMRPRCTHHATAAAAATTAISPAVGGSSPTTLDFLCVSCQRLRCAKCRDSCVSAKHVFHDVGDRLQHERQSATAAAPEVVEARRLASAARQEIVDLLQRVEAVRDLADKAETVHRRAHASFRRAQDELTRVKDAILLDLETALSDADNVVDQVMKIDDRLKRDFTVAHSYCSLLLSSTSDDACILDQQAVVLSRLNSMLRSADEARDLLREADAANETGLQRQPIDLLSTMVKRLQELQKQPDSTTSPSAADVATAPAADAAATVATAISVDGDAGAKDGPPATVAAVATAAHGEPKDKIVEISNDIAEERPSDPVASPLSASTEQQHAASHSAAQSTASQRQEQQPQQQQQLPLQQQSQQQQLQQPPPPQQMQPQQLPQRVDSRDASAVSAGLLHSQQPPPTGLSAASTLSTSSDDAVILPVRQPTTAGTSTPFVAEVDNSIDEGVLDNGGHRDFRETSRPQAPTLQQTPRSTLQPQPPLQQQQSSRQQQLQPPQQQEQKAEKPLPHGQQQGLPQQQQQLPQPQQQQSGRQSLHGEALQLAVPDPDIYRVAGRPTGSVRVQHDCRDVALTPNGHLLLAALKIGLIELDASGREVSRWTPPPTDEGQTDTASTVEVLCSDDGDDGGWCAVVGLVDSQSVVVLRRSGGTAHGNGDQPVPPPWVPEREPIMLRAAPIRLSVCQPGLLAVAGAQVSVTQEQQGGKSKGHGSGGGLVVRRSWSPGPYLDVLQLDDGRSLLCEMLGYCIQSVTVTPRIVAVLSNDTQRTDDGRQRFVIDAFCVATGRRLWRHGKDSEPADLCASLAQPGASAVEAVLYAALQNAGRVVAIRAKNGSDAGELLSEQINGLQAPFRIALAQIGLQTTVAVLTARREVLLYPVS